jgi:maltose alpha-D-glucosyltransferase/alpha-amylase
VGPNDYGDDGTLDDRPAAGARVSTPTAADTLVERVVRYAPDAVRLAEVLSLAASIEPRLVRACRLELLPGVPASAEAELWLSPLVESASPRGFVLLREAVDELRGRLVNDRERVAAASELLRREHAGASPTIRLEEEVTRAALGLEAEDDVDHLLGRALKTMVSSSSSARSVARWAVQAAPRLASEARASPAARVLEAAARARIGDSTAAVSVPGEGRRWLRWALPPLPELAVGVQLLEDGLELTLPPRSGAQLISLARTSPLAVEIAAAGAAHGRRVVVEPSGATRIDAGQAVVAALDSDGSQWHVPGPSQALALALAPGAERLALAGADGSLVIWERGRRVPLLAENLSAPATALAFTRAGDALLAGHGDGAIVLRRLDSTDAPVTLDRASHAIRAVATSDDGTLAAWLTDSLGGIVRLAGDAPAVRFRPSSPGRVVAFTARSIAVGGVTTLTLHDPTSGELLLQLGQTGAPLVAAGPSAVAAADDGGEVVVWEVSSGSEFGSSELERVTLDGVAALAYSHAREAFVAVDRSGRAFVLTEKGPEQQWVAPPIGAEPSALALAPDAATLVAATRANALELRTSGGDTYLLTRTENLANAASQALEGDSTPPDPAHWFEPDPLWFKQAVFYEIHIRGFADGNDDGSGDLRGLTEKLDYLQWLGVDCIWLLPMYFSPLRDGGYDIADFFTVHPDYGTVEDFRMFVEEAHQRGIRVIAELVMNHTSSDHPWFQEARSDPKSPKRDWYVWSDTDDKYTSARIILLGTEVSNWTWDPIAGQYFWHRFYSHQPDLNYDNPEVQEAMLNVLRFWLDLGLDGFRLNALPYLFERDGTNCENLPETHAYLKRVRAEVDAHYADKVLVAEANQWPHDVVDYLGDGDECHVVPNCVLAPRMFMALAREDASPIIEILERMPQIPDNGQWALFLRNHDELTLEMLSDEERDYMWAEYAADPRAKLNLGIRRRLAPLLNNGRDEIQLMTAILFSLPGSPILYYGDEIGMGDNIYLGDRDGVRTPMQWTGEPNGGFSRADFAKLYLPPLMDPVYGYQAVNVEAQLQTPTSLLRWMHRFIALRKNYPVFALGTYTGLRSGNPRILAHIREYEDEIALCVHNLSRSPQAVELDLSRFEGLWPEEMFGRSRFPRIDENPYRLSVGARGYFFFWLRPAQEAA